MSIRFKARYRVSVLTPYTLSIFSNLTRSLYIYHRTPLLHENGRHKPGWCSLLQFTDGSSPRVWAARVAMILSTLTSLSAHLRKQARPRREEKLRANHEVHTHNAVQAKSHTQSDPESSIEEEPGGLTLVQELGEAINTPQRLDEQDPAAALDTLPDDLLLHVVVACGGEWLIGVPELDAVSALGSLCKDVLQQLSRLLPFVYRRVHGLTHGRTHGPWRVVLLFTGEPTATVVDEAWRGHVRSIDARGTTLTPAVAKRVVPELLGVGCSLLDLKLEGLQLGIGSWRQTFGEAAVCSTALLELQLDDCGLSGPLPELNLPALQILWMSSNQMSGGLEPLMRCTALQELDGRDKRV